MNVITQTSELETFCQNCTSAPFITVDTEFMRESTFWSKLCLIQVACGEHEAIIDPLSETLDLAPFMALMANTKVTKVMHSARQDLEIFYNIAGALPTPLFDTQIGAMALGYGDSIGYGNLVHGRLGRHVDKGARFTDWSRRPLEPRQLEYALADVTHLRDLYPGMVEELEKQDRMDWIEEETEALLDPGLYSFEPGNAWKRLRIRKTSARYLSVLKAVAAWREQKAQDRNVPRNRILKDDGLYDLANNAPTDPGKLSRLRAIPRGFEKSSSAKELLEVIRDALKTPEKTAPKFDKPQNLPSGIGPSLDMLKTLLRLRSEAHNIAPKMIGSVRDLEQLAAYGESSDTGLLKGWRRKIYGEDALKLLSGEIGLRLKDGKVVAEPL